MNIHGYSQLTLLDYPGKLACTIFCGSCNFRCPFCHNASLVKTPGSQPTIPEERILEHLSKRRSMLEGICITGGEPTLQADLPDFMEKLRSTGYLLKLDTNGSNPDMLEKLIKNKLVDFIAMDIKASPDNYAKATGLKEVSMDKIFRSVELIMESGLDYEFRTTVVDGIHSDEDFKAIAHWIKGASHYYLQNYKNSGEIINPEGLSSVCRSKLEHYIDILKNDIPTAKIRGDYV